MKIYQYILLYQRLNTQHQLSYKNGYEQYQ